MTDTMKTLATASLMTAGIFLAANAGAIAVDAASSSAKAQYVQGGRNPAGIVLTQNAPQVRPMPPITRSPVPGNGAGRLIVDPPVTPFSPVPGRPGPGPGYNGNWFGCASTQVHGSFNVRTCANGSYRVIGGGLFCTGTLNHNVASDGLHIRLHRTSCNQGTDWSGGMFICGGFFGGQLNGVNCRFVVTAEARYNGWRNESVVFQ